MKSTKLQTKAVVRALALAGLVSVSLPAAAVTYNLRAEAVDKMMPDGTTVPMWGYALDGASCVPVAPATTCPATVPGPDLPVPAGDTVLEVVLSNTLAAPVSMVIPGLGLPTVDGAAAQPTGADTDGSGRQRVQSFVDPVSNGTPRTYRWTGVQPGTYLYHSGSHPQVQVPMGLYGAVMAQSATAYDHDVKLLYSEVDPVLNAAVAGGTYGTAGGPTSAIDYHPSHFLVNGAAGGDIAAGSPGQRTLVRFLNAGLRTQVPTVIGQHLALVGEDGHAYQYPKEQYSVTLPAMKTVDAMLTPTGVGSFPVQNRRLDPGSAAHPAGAMTARLTIGASASLLAAAADNLAATEDTQLVVAAPGVLANDTDSAGTPGGTSLNLTAALVSGTSHGSLSLAPDGSLTYTPDADYSGPDSFTYQAVDGSATSTTTAAITVAPVNDAPVAAADGPYNGFAGVLLSVAAPGVLGNDSDPDGDALTAVASGTALAGLTLNPDGSFTYTNATAGNYSFQYVARDPAGADSTPVTVNISLSGSNRAPVAKADSATTKMNTLVVINVAANDTDPDGNLAPNTVTITSKPNRGGTATSNGDGTVTYTPKLNFLGTDSFTYDIKDTLGLVSKRATVRVNVTR
jgi:VCBS repeat-containing protein